MYCEKLSHIKGITWLLENRGETFPATPPMGTSVYSEPDGCTHPHRCSWQSETVDGACLAPRTHIPESVHIKPDPEQEGNICGHRTIRNKPLHRPKGNTYIQGGKLEDRAVEWVARHLGCPLLFGLSVGGTCAKSYEAPFRGCADPACWLKALEEK